MARSRNGAAAACLSTLGTVSVLLAFATASWIVADGESDNPKIERIGLWVICYNDFEDPNHMYDTKFKNCWWVFERKQYIINDIIFKGFYSSTQILFSISVAFSVVGLFYTAMYMMCFKVSLKRLIEILYTIWGLQLTSAIFGTVGLVIFGVHGNSRFWMPEWEHKSVGWSFFIAVVGIILLYISVALFIIEERVRKLKNRKSTARSDNDDPKQLLNAI